ncbi:FAD-dependent oxidoreductase [Mesorhizobium sp. CAU 1732]|uniref:FAD-dependent oxidoreductase n=1 Tax=Mesorhizobium sp. CAU 1732 TaxID=3140358 RepID=UPI00326019E1
MSGPGISREMPAVVDVETAVLVIGAGACGLVAALRAAHAGAEVVVVERDASPTGSTSMSSGFIPAPATRFQHAIGVTDDTADRFAGDLDAKTHGRVVPHLARLASERIGPALEWLADDHGLEWIMLDDFLYPGHSRHRMHAVPEKTGATLMARLLAAVAAAGIPVVTEAEAQTLHLGSADTVRAVTIVRPNGARETIGCKALVIASSGFGGNAELVGRHIPEIASGLYFGHAGNRGSALGWGEALGARVEHLSGYQGHGSLAHPHGILISWALMMRGGVQVNAAGERFSGESGGYSEQAVHVLRQPGGIAWDVYDEAIHDFALGFPDYRDAVEAGAVRFAATVSELAAIIGAAEAVLSETIGSVERFRTGEAADPFGRDFTQCPALKPPYVAVRVTGALFHTQGGLMIDETARVMREDGSAFANLFAGGGAACGVSGPDVSGYLSGNGLLTAVAFGFVAGESAAREAAFSEGR